jgi:mRNA-degrading endonuclease RelE of RelBE toxin-antitoxin system
MDCSTCHSAVKQQYICLDCLRKKVDQKKSQIQKLQKQHTERIKNAEQVLAIRQRSADYELRLRQGQYRIQQLKRDIQQLKDENTNERLECIQANTVNNSKEETLNIATETLKTSISSNRLHHHDPEIEKSLQQHSEKLRKARRRTLEQLFKTMSLWEEPEEDKIRRIYIFTKYTWLPFTDTDLVDHWTECKDKGIISNNTINAALGYLAVLVNSAAQCLSTPLPHELHYAMPTADSRPVILEVVASQIVTEHVTDSEKLDESASQLNIDSNMGSGITHIVTRAEPSTVQYPLFLTLNPNDLVMMGTPPPLVGTNGTVNNVPTPRDSSAPHHPSFTLTTNTESGNITNSKMLDLFRYAIHLLNENVIALCNAQGIIVSKHSNLLVNLLTMQSAAQIGAIGPFMPYNKDTAEIVKDSKRAGTIMIRRDIGHNYFIDGDQSTNILRVHKPNAKKSSRSDVSSGTKQEPKYPSLRKGVMLPQYVNENYLDQSTAGNNGASDALMIANKSVEESTMGHGWEHITVNNKKK